MQEQKLLISPPKQIVHHAKVWCINLPDSLYALIEFSGVGYILRYKNLVLIFALTAAVGCTQPIHAQIPTNPSKAETVTTGNSDSGDNAATNMQSPKELCVEPFCSFAPVQMPASDIAKVIREMASLGEINYQFSSYESKQKNDPLAKAFLANNNLKYIDPLLVAVNKDDKQLSAIFSKDCLHKLTHGQKDKSSSKGPFLVYKLMINGESHVAVAIFGWAEEHSEEEDTKRRYQMSRSAGFLRIIKDVASCEIIGGVKLGTRQDAANSEYSYTPRFFGVGYDDHDSPFAYEFIGETSYENLYSLQYHSLNPTARGTDKQWRVYISHFPGDFNPFSFVPTKKEKQ